MAVEKFVRGKVDSAKHVGKYHNERMLQAAKDHEQEEREVLAQSASLSEYLEAMIEPEMAMADLPERTKKLPDCKTD